MVEERIDRIREKLHSLLDEKADYNEVLKVSQELDDCIYEFTFEQLNNTKIEDISIKEIDKR